MICKNCLLCEKAIKEYAAKMLEKTDYRCLSGLYLMSVLGDYFGCCHDWLIF